MRLFAKRLTIALAGMSLAVVHAEACAQQKAARDRVSNDSLHAARQFVRGFYDWYTPLTLANLSVRGEYYVLTRADQYLDPSLAAALRADSIAQQDDPMTATRQTLDFDPFLASQDPCEPYEVVDVRRRGNAFLASMRGCHAKGIGPVVELRAIGGRWRITNILYGDGDLKSYLCQWAKADLRPEKRPAKCGR